MTFHGLIKLTILCLFYINGIGIGKLYAQEYWVNPPSSTNKYCTQQSCICEKNNRCTLNAYLLKQLKAGDAVYFNQGVYSALIINDIHGTVTQPIKFIGSFSTAIAKISLNPGGYRDLIEIKSSSHILLTGFTISHSPRAGIRVNNSHNITIENNKLTNNGVWGIFTNHSNHFIATKNTIIGPAKQHGIYHSNSGDNVKITANLIQGFDGCGVHMNGDITMGGADNVEGDGIISNVEISNNYLSSNGLVGGSAINLDGVINGNIHNNIIVNNKAAGISIFKGDGAIGSGKISISDNLMVMAKRSRWAVNIKDSTGDNSFTNNIMISQDKFRGIYDVLPVDLKVNNRKKSMPFITNNNLYGYGRNLIVLNDEKYLPLDRWQRNYNYDNKSSKILYKYVISNEGKLSLPISKLVKDRKIATHNPYLHLLF